jgi:hypothetical protein
VPRHFVWQGLPTASKTIAYSLDSDLVPALGVRDFLASCSHTLPIGACHVPNRARRSTFSPRRPVGAKSYVPSVAPKREALRELFTE